jgi:eukaryotic-like serine/threonine-protein kinase
VELEADPDDLIGQVVASRYCVEARLGHGAMGTVYRARHLKVGRAFAIKVLHPQFLADDKARRRFAREAELAGSLDHPNIVRVVDAGETPEGLRYLVMEFVDGTTLFDLIHAAAPMPAARVISIVRQLCDGLAHAHERGLIHRDFKTENVLVETDPHGGDLPRIADFGISILRDDAASSNPQRLTTAGLVLGTPHYMAPEHATGGAIDHRIDLFALGVMCFEMLTGRGPFDGDGVDVARANLLADTPIMSVRVPGLVVDPLLEALTRKLMMKSRDLRPPTASAVRELIDLIERDRPAAAAALDLPFDVMFEPPRASSALWSPQGAAIPAEFANAAPSTPHPAPWTGAPVVRPPTAPALAPPHQMPPHQVLLHDAHGPHHAPAPHHLPWVPDETEQMRPVTSSRRAVVAITAVAALAVFTAAFLALRPQRTARSAPAPVAMPPVATSALDAGTFDAAELPAPMASAPAPTPPAPTATPPAPPRVEPPPVAAKSPRIATRPAMAGKPQSEPVTAPDPSPPERIEQAPAPPSAAPAPQVTLAAAPPVQPAAAATPASVARLYASVGKQLKALDQSRGSAATADLWPLYLRVRINDVIADPVKCAEADTLLRHLDHEIAQRSR